jgi:hypothetical protein
MKSLFLFPFRVIAFFIRMMLYVVTIPLVIAFRLIGIFLPETSKLLNSVISGFIRVFKF